MPAKKEDLPSTLERSPKKVRDTYEKTLDNAHEEYDSEERAHRAAWASVKHVAEKKGDHWELKGRKGPADAQAAKSGAAARRGGETAGGIDANKTKEALYEGRQAGRHRGPLDHEQAGARPRAQEEQRPGDGEGAPRLGGRRPARARAPDAGASASGARAGARP
ncbi:MAG: ChaB family protein, partial [Solirubrobacteraceae bacterium]